MAGIKVKVSIEPGDKKATLRLTHTSAEEGQEPEVVEVKVGGKAEESSRDFELQLGGKLETQVVDVVELVYDPAQMMVTEKPSAESQLPGQDWKLGEGKPPKPEPTGGSGRSKSQGAHASGAKESSHETSESHSTRR